MGITKNEQAILRGAMESEYGDQSDIDGGATWTFSAIEHSGLDGKVAAGVISSLVKKGLAIVEDDGEKDGSGEPLTSFNITPLGHAYLKYLPIMVWDTKKWAFKVEICVAAVATFEPLPVIREAFITKRENAVAWLDQAMVELARVMHDAKAIANAQ